MVTVTLRSRAGSSPVVLKEGASATASDLAGYLEDESEPLSQVRKPSHQQHDEDEAS